MEPIEGTVKAGIKCELINPIGDWLFGIHYFDVRPFIQGPGQDKGEHFIEFSFIFFKIIIGRFRRATK